jgi:hypothetical protein
MSGAPIARIERKGTNPMSIDPRNLLVLQGTHTAADILGVQECYKVRMADAMRNSS